MKRFLMASLACPLLCVAISPAAAQTQSFQADYSVTLVGLPVAKASFSSTFSDSAFRIEGRMSSSGIARIFDDTTGTSQVEGTIRRGEVQPRSFSSSYRTGRKHSVTTIRYAGGKVASFENTPEPRKGSSWVEVTDEHLAAALDPLSATLVPTTDPVRVCDRTVRFFDGELRADIHLSPQSEAGDGRVTCTARFAPVAGYRQGRKQIEFMKNRSRMTITFAPLGRTGFYAPVDASIGTQIGTLRIAATRVTIR